MRPGSRLRADGQTNMCIARPLDTSTAHVYALRSVQVLYELLTWRLPWSFADMSPFKVRTAVAVGQGGRLQPGGQCKMLASYASRRMSCALLHTPILSGRCHHHGRRAAGGAAPRGAARPRHSRLVWPGCLPAADAVRGLGQVLLCRALLLPLHHGGCCSAVNVASAWRQKLRQAAAVAVCWHHCGQTEHLSHTHLLLPPSPQGVLGAAAGGAPLV